MYISCQSFDNVLHVAFLLSIVAHSCVQFLLAVYHLTFFLKTLIQSGKIQWVAFRLHAL